MAEESKLPTRRVPEKLPVSQVLDEAVLERSEPRLKLALQAAGGGAWDWDFTSGKAWWSDEMYDLWGVEWGSPVELEPSLARVHQQDRELLRQALSKAIAERTGFQAEVRICHPVLGERWVATVGRPVRDGAGQVTRLVGITLDVTARRHVEDALRASNERLELLATVGESLLRAEDPQVIIEQVCRKVMSHLDCEFFFNYTVVVPGRRLYLTASAGVSAETAAEIQHLDFGVAVCGCVARDGRRIVAEDIQHSDDPRADLVRSWGVQAYCCHPLVALGRVIGTLSFGTRMRPSFTKDEISLMKSVADLVAVALQRLQAEESLRESEERYRTLFEAMTEGFALYEIVADEQGKATDFRLLDANSAHDRISRMRRADILGKSIREIMPADRFHLIEDYAQVVLTGRPFHTEIYSPQSQRWFEIVAFRSGMTQVAVVFSDVSQRKQAEAEREQLIARLEAQNAELERFTYTVSHDLKSPLITIKGYIGMLSEELAETDIGFVHDDLIRISKAADTMGELLEDLLELSRIGRLVNPPEDVPLGELVQESLRVVGANIEAGDIHVDVIEPLPMLYGDRIRLLEVLQNLVENAVKYMGNAPQPRIEIGTRLQDEETICYVRDNGIGVEPRFHEKVFGLFEQLDPKAGGTGIGLAVVKRIIDVHGGRVWVESEGKGQGSTFCFAVPKKRVSGSG